MPYTGGQPAFSGGEIGENLLGRSDTQKYQTALRRARNVLLSTSGGFYNRPGLLDCGAIRTPNAKARLIPFQFSVSQAYAIELGHLTMRFVANGGYVLGKELRVLSIIPDPAGGRAVMDGPHGFRIGMEVYFTGIQGMTELNGRTARINGVSVDQFTFDIDVSGFGAFTGATGGVAGDAEGGTGGNPAPPPPDEPTPPPPPFVDIEPLPDILPPYDRNGYEVLP